jgi:hypothetical protein
MKKKAILGSVAVVVLLALAAWGFGWFGKSKYSADPAVAELEKLRDSNLAKEQGWSEDERQASREDFRKRMEGLTEAQRRDFFESSAPMFIQVFQRRIDEFLALPPDKQREVMDKRIDAMVAQGGPPGRPPGADSPPSPQRIDQFRKQMLDWTTPDQRDHFEKVMTMYRDRMKERGVTPPGPGGGFF